MEILKFIVEVLVGLSIIGTAATFILKWTFGISHKIKDLENKICEQNTTMENKIMEKMMPFAQGIVKEQNNPLSPDEIDRMNRYMEKLKNKNIDEEEAIELKRLLNIEKEEAEKKDNYKLLWAIGIAHSAIGLLAYFNNKK